MKRLLLALLLLVCCAAEAQEQSYTLVLGLSTPGDDLRGYRDFARYDCPPELTCLTYFDLVGGLGCNGFFACVSRMMACAKQIIFLMDKPEGLLSEDDELCTLENRGRPDDGQHTGLEICILRHCEWLYGKTLWTNRRGFGTMSFAQSNDECPAQ